MQHRFGPTACGGWPSSAPCCGTRGISRAARSGRRHGVGPSRSGRRWPRGGRPCSRSLGRRDRRHRRSRTSRGRSRGSLGAALAAADRERKG